MRGALSAAAVGAVIGAPMAVLILFNAPLITNGVRQGLEICINTLLPSLFPFLILSSFLTKSGADSFLGKALGRPICAALGLSPGGVGALLLSILCGFPIGTITATALLERGELDCAEWERLMPILNNPGASFLIGAVGGGMLGSVRAGVALFCIVWLSALLLALTERLLMGRKTVGAAVALPPTSHSTLTADLTASIGGALATLLPIFSFVIFFSCLATCLSAALAALGAPVALSVLIIGFLELTAGVGKATSALSVQTAFCLCAAFSGFSGLSFCLQFAAMTEAHHPRLWRYLFKRLTIGAISALLALAYLKLTGDPLVSEKSTAALATANGWQSTTVLICLFLLSGAVALRLLSAQGRARTVSPSKRKTP